MRKTLLFITAIIGMLAFQGKADNYYLAGEFNNWQAGDSNYKFEQVEGDRFYELVYPEEIFEGEFKITTDTWQLSWGSYSQVFPNQWIFLTTEEFNNIYVWNNGKIKNAKFIFDPSAESLLVEGEYVSPALIYGLYNETDGLLPFEGVDGKPGVFHGEFKIDKVMHFQIAFYEDNKPDIMYMYGCPNGENENINVGEANVFEYEGGQYVIEPGEYDMTLCLPYLIVTDANHKAKDVYIIQGAGTYGADFVYLAPAIFNFNLPEDTQYTQYIKFNDGEFSPYELLYSDYGTGYETTLIPIIPNTFYNLESYVVASSGDQILYQSEIKNMSFTSQKINLGFSFYPEESSVHSALIRYEIFNNLLFTDAEYEITYYCSDNSNIAPEVTGVFNTDNAYGEYRITGLEPNTLYDLSLDVTMYTQYGNITVKTDNPGWFWTQEDSGVEKIIVDEAPRYFNLNGMEVKNPQGGIYIEVLNGKTRKVIK